MRPEVISSLLVERKRMLVASSPWKSCGADPARQAILADLIARRRGGQAYSDRFDEFASMLVLVCFATASPTLPQPAIAVQDAVTDLEFCACETCSTSHAALALQRFDATVSHCEWGDPAVLDLREASLR